MLRFFRGSPWLGTLRALSANFSSRRKALQIREKRDLAELAANVGEGMTKPLWKDARTGGTVLFLGMGRVRFIAQEMAVLKSFEMAGLRPVVIIPNDPLIVKTYRLFGVEDLVLLGRYQRRRDTSLPPGLFDGINSLPELLRVTVEGVRSGKYAASTLMRMRRSGEFDFSDKDVRRMLRKSLARSFGFARIAHRVLDSLSPSALVVVDRGYSPSGEFFDVCMSRGIPVFSWNAAHRNNTLMMKRYTRQNQDVHPSSLSERSWNLMRTMPWSDAEWDLLRDELVGCYARGEWYSEVGTQFLARSVDRVELTRRLGLDEKKKTAVIFPHIFWDATFFWGTDLFDNYEQWFTETVRAACANTRLNWIIKVHPANLAKDRRDGFNGEHSEYAAIRRVAGELPAHVRVIPADSDISTLSLFQLMDYCLTVRGTVGMEAACFGIPVLTAGTGRYDRLGFTIDSDSRESYLRKLSGLPDLGGPDPAQTELARQYAYGVLLCRPIRLQAISMEYRKDRGAELDVRINARTVREVKESPDLVEMSRWIASAEEDYMSCPYGHTTVVTRATNHAIV